MGQFLLGSTVVLLWPKDTITFQPDWQAGRAVRMGEAMGAGCLNKPFDVYDQKRKRTEHDHPGNPVVAFCHPRDAAGLAVNWAKKS